MSLPCMCITVQILNILSICIFSVYLEECRIQEILYPKLYGVSFSLFYLSVFEMLSNWVYPFSEKYVDIQ